MTKSDKIYCEKCGRSFNPGSYVHHACVVNAKSSLMSRKMDKLLSKKKKYRGLMVDLGNHNAEVPFPASEEQDLKSSLQSLNEIRASRAPKIGATVMKVLHERRMVHPTCDFWRRHYS